MKMKYAAIIGILCLALGGFIIAEESESSEAATALFSVTVPDNYTNVMAGISAPGYNGVIAYPGETKYLTVDQGADVTYDTYYLGGDDQWHFAYWERNSSTKYYTHQVTFNDVTSGFNLKAVYEPGEYTFTLTFDANGGSGAPATMTHESPSGGNYYFTIPQTIPYKTGYSFSGWATTSTGQPTYQPGNTVQVPANSTVTLYAIYSLNEYTCYLVFNKNGGTGGPSTQSYTSTSTSDHAFTIPVQTPSRSGYTFLGWNTSPSGSGTWYHSLDIIYVPYNGSVELYAIWDINEYTYYLYYNMNGGAGGPNNASYTSTSESIYHRFTVSSVEPVRNNYTFLGWSTDQNDTVARFVAGDQVSVYLNDPVTLYAVWQPIQYTCTLSYDANGGTGAPATQSYTGTATTPHTFTISNTTPTKTGYIFRGWSASSLALIASYQPGQTIEVPYNGSTKLYAVWGSADDSVLWSNGSYNGRVDILFKFEASDNFQHTMDIPLWLGNVQNNVTAWTETDYSLTIEVSYPSTQVAVTLTGGDAPISKTIRPGNWSTFILSIDPGDGLITMTPIRTFSSFTDYTIYDNQTKTVLDFSKSINNVAIYNILHNDVGSATNHVRFSVVSTSVFLDTYGIVLYNPTINLYDYFPQYDNIRVNFYSFALYGESITINNQQYAVVNGKITIQYVSDHGDNFLPGVMPNATVKTRTFELTNIYITYDRAHCYLTFVNDRFTIDLGAYAEGDESISMTGLWYFATMVYNPYTAMEKHLSDWKFIPETTSAQMVLIFIGLLIVAGAAVAIHARKRGLGIIDLIIIGGALLVGILMLGM